jgi:hypothetical protein
VAVSIGLPLNEMPASYVFTPRRVPLPEALVEIWRKEQREVGPTGILRPRLVFLH